jgi:aldehyde dehydrogenase (NAD+)
MKEYKLYIGGEFVDSLSQQTFDSFNPFNGEIVARCARASREDAQRAIEAARTAFDNGPWPRMSGAERSAMIKSISDKINANKDLLAALETDDSGSTIRKVREDVALSGRAMNYFSS